MSEFFKVHPYWYASGDRTANLIEALETGGIARQMPPADPPPDAAPAVTGGGDLNGSATTSFLQGQAGTAGNRNGVPRASLRLGGGNYCGTV